MYQTIDLGKASDLPDGTFVEAFETLELPPERFRHADHVRLAWIYLREDGLIGTLERLTASLRRFASHHGAADKYHETVTWGLVFLIHERMAKEGVPSDWPGFAEANPDLLRWLDGAFFERYRPEVLDSDVARRIFVLPG